MTQQPKQLSEGEQRLRTQRNKYWRYLGVMALIAGCVGAFTGAIGDAFEQGIVPQWVLLVALTVLVAGFVWLCFDYYRRLDEVDLLDNLWCNTVAFNAGFLIWFVWWILADVGLTTQPSATPIMLTMMAISLIVYAARKLGLR